MNFYLLLSLIFFLSVTSINSFSYGFSNAEVNDTPGKSYRPQIHSSGENVFVVWTDDSSGNADIFFAKSTNAGKTFDPPINLSENEGASAFPRIAVSENNVYVTWYDYSAGESDIFFAKSNDAGITFDTINLSDNPGGSYNQWVLASEDRVFVVWNDDSHPPSFEIDLRDDIPFHKHLGNYEIDFAISEDGGNSFKTINLSNSSGYSINPRMTLFEDNLYIVWNDEVEEFTDIFFIASRDKGHTFSSPINISHSLNDSEDAGIIGIENNVFLIWKEKSTDTTDIFFSKSDDYGKSFTDPINLSNSKERSAISRDNQIAVIGDRVFVVWYDNVPGGDAFLAYSTDGGNYFEAPINLSKSSGKVEFSQIIKNQKGLEIIWNDDSLGNWEVFSLTSLDNGTTFGSNTNLSQDQFDSRIFILGPQLASQDNRVYTIWENNTSSTSNLVLNSKILRTSTPGDLLLQTENGAVDIEVRLDTPIIEPEKTIGLSLDFLNPASGKSLKDVNYSLKIIDSTQIPIVEKEFLYAPEGFAEHSMIFPDTGAFSLVIDVHGLGSSKPFDNLFSGTTSSVFTVVPEFPLSSILVLSLLFLPVILLKRLELIRN